MAAEKPRRTLRVLAVALALAASACFFGGKSTAEKAQDSLTKAIQAHQAGHLTEALALYKDVLKQDPQNKWAHYNIGQIEQTQGQLAAAENEYRTALAADPNLLSALFNLAILRNNAGAKQEALALYRRAIQIDPNNAAAHLNLGFLLLDLKQKAEGEKELKRAVDLDPTLASRIPGSAEK